MTTLDKPENPHIVNRWAGKEVYVELPFPIPTGDGNVKFPTVRGTLIDASSDGIIFQVNGATDDTYLPWARVQAVRSVSQIRLATELPGTSRRGA